MKQSLTSKQWKAVSHYTLTRRLRLGMMDGPNRMMYLKNDLGEVVKVPLSEIVDVYERDSTRDAQA